MPDARNTHCMSLNPQVWHVFTDGSSRHERRQTFSGWAARAAQPETRQIRQISGARPGGTSLEAETEALLAGLQLVPAGAVARLYSDLDPAALREVLQGPVALAARNHLHALWIHPIGRNSNRHHHDVHLMARAAELSAREGARAEAAGLSNAVLDLQDLARAGQSDAPLALHTPWQLPGHTQALQVQLEPVKSSKAAGAGRRAALASLQAAIQGQGRTSEEAMRNALARSVPLLARASLVDLTVPLEWLPAALEVARDLGTVRVLLADQLERAEEPSPGN
ncbi:reverse transcriptase-like protein [Deinococcus sp. QL22]|uniref:reverse transcriptase-like protein n=1 Tax=Deinococcus sp. QL22 TaxID=2939437 RepID=UPI002017DB9B|nr:reverse transcriptase-like protein [Deinococcus sp. QL22]UQN09095.1 reverse transcriptase-like protein [Deinococcus sp. QL22]